MNDPTPSFRTLETPPELASLVALKGSLLMRESRPVRRPRRARKLVADLSLAAFCLVHLLWGAHVVGLIP